LGAALTFTAATTSVTAASAQSVTAGDLAGTVTDTTGAVVPNAMVTVTNPKTGAKKTTKTGAAGEYRVSLLTPGTYHVVIATSGFQTTSADIEVDAGVVANGDTKLTIGDAGTTVEVTAEAPLLHTESAEISTEFTQEQIASLPNPGNDLTFIAQTSPGAVMNTQGGYGNFASFGLPATANTFTVNGGYENDPFLNVNNSGATNLLLGNNDVGTVTVLSNAYGAQYGGLGGTQVNEITRSGGNHFHGDATYQWNGSRMNGNDFFNNFEGSPKPRSNANQWSGAIGGPIIRDKTFFFFNTEGLRVLIPVRGTIYAPSTSFIAATEANAAAQSAASLAFYQGFFNQYTSAKGYSTAIADPGDANAVIFPANSSNFGHEAQYTARIDQRLGAKDNLFIHATYDTGTQPTYTSLLNPLFDALSPQPQWSGQFDETHVFTPNITNQFVFAEIYYKAVFQNTNQAAANAIAPFGLAFFGAGDLGNNGFNNPGGEDFVWPQGRHVNGYQFVDDFSATKGKHTIKAGMYLRRDDVTDYGPQVYTTPLIESTEASFEAASADIYIQQFPTRLTQPVSVYNLGLYVQDQWKPTKDLVLTAGIRFEHNSNPVCHTSCFARLATNFGSLPTAATTPYSNASGNGLIDSGQYRGFSDFQKVGYEPRIGFSYTPSSLGSKTVIRGGFGMFADAFPAQVADSLLNNAPTNVGFTVLGDIFGNPAPLYNGATGSFSQQAAASNAGFQSGFKSGGSLSTLSATVPNFAAPSFVSPATTIKYPTYEEYNLAIEQQIGKSTTFGIDYVGNHTYHQPVLNTSANAYNAGGTGFPGLPTTIPNQNFSTVNQVYSGASSNYNGVVLTATKRASYLTLQFNYTYSHALDEISNGGFDGFSGNSTAPTNPNPALLRQNYGNSDYDTRHYISANYVFTLPYHGGPKVLAKGWEIAGDVFHSTGLPFTFTDGTTASGSLANYGGALYAKQTVAHIPNKCSGNGIEHPGPGAGCPARLDFAPATDFGQQERNQIFGPNYTDTDMSVYKSFDFPHYEGAHLKLGVQFFNLLNHPNFAQPSHDIAPCYNQAGVFVGCDGTSAGTISGTVNPPTSILGSFLGGDASPRLIQLKANINF
jgi:hypothetical protein